MESIRNTHLSSHRSLYVSFYVWQEFKKPVVLVITSFPCIFRYIRRSARISEHAEFAYAPTHEPFKGLPPTAACRLRRRVFTTVTATSRGSPRRRRHRSCIPRFCGRGRRSIVAADFRRSPLLSNAIQRGRYESRIKMSPTKL